MERREDGRTGRERLHLYRLVCSGEIVLCLEAGSGLPGKCAGLVRINGEIYLKRLFRKKFLNVFRPLHDAETSAVKVVIKTDFDSF